MRPAVAESAFLKAAHDTRVLASDAAHRLEEGVLAARRSYRIARRQGDDAVEDASAYIARSPLRSIAVALGAGVMVGVAASLIACVVGGRSAKRD